jgi:hypothetical protein
MKKLIGQVVNGKFIDGKPKEINNREHQLHREFVRTDMRERYAKDIVQPYKNGQVNQEYVEAWGKVEATKQFGIESQIE